MILVDTSVWVEHLRRGLPDLAARLDAGEVLGHALVTGELAMGNLGERELILAMLENLPRAALATHDEVMGLVARETLHGQGIGYVDACLLASVRLTPDARLWTRDRRLAEIAHRMNLGMA